MRSSWIICHGPAVFCFLAITSILAGCRNPSTVVETEATTLAQSWVERVEALPARETRVLTWFEAVRLLEEHNPEVRKAGEERWRAQRGIGQVYKNLLPYMQLQAGVYKRVAELDELSFDDIRWDLNVYAFLSGFLTLHRDVYTAELTYLRANLLRELVLREKIVELHRLFISARQLELAGRRLSESEQLLNSLPSLSRSVESAPATVEFMREQLRSFQAKLDSDLMKILAMPDYHLELSGEGIPVVDYMQTPLVATNASQVGVLRRKLLAIELVGAKARIRGAKLQYWPDISLYMSSGPLWTTSAGQTIWWSKDDLRLSANAYLPIDINGYIRNRVRDAKADMEFLKREIEMREAVLALEFDDRRQALVQAERDLSELERKRQLLMQLISIEGSEHLGERLRQWAEIEIKRDDAFDRRAKINSFFLFFDEAFWRGPNAPAALVPVPSETKPSSRS